MARFSPCADSPFLLGELLPAASEYVDRCEKSLGGEDVLMVELACEQVFPLRNRVARLDKKLGALEAQLHARLKNEGRKSRKAAGAP